MGAVPGSRDSFQWPDLLTDYLWRGNLFTKGRLSRTVIVCRSHIDLLLFPLPFKFKLNSADRNVFPCFVAIGWNIQWPATDKEWPIMNPPCRHLLAFYRKSNALFCSDIPSCPSIRGGRFRLQVNSDTFKSLWTRSKVVLTEYIVHVHRKTESWKINGKPCEHSTGAVVALWRNLCAPPSFSGWIMSHHVNDWRPTSVKQSSTFSENL